MKTNEIPTGSKGFAISAYSIRNRGIFVFSLLPTINLTYAKRIDSEEIMRSVSVCFGFLVWGYVVEIYKHSDLL